MAHIKTYKYKAVHDNGWVTRGVLTALNEVSLYERLEKNGFSLIFCKEVKPSFTSKLGFSRNRLTTRDKIQFYKSLEQMQNAGIPLLTSLENCVTSALKAGTRDIYSSLHGMVSDGMTLSEAMAWHESIFSKIECTVVRSREENGDLQGGFKYLCDFLRKQDELKRKIKKATMYPLILLTVIIVAVVMMLGIVVPEIIDFVVMVKGVKDLPLATWTLMHTSNFFQAYWQAIFIGLGVFIVFVAILRRQSKKFRYRVDALMLMLPVLGPTFQKLEVSKFCTTFSSLYSSGLDFVSCIKLSRNVVDNSVIAETLGTIQKDVIEGKSFSKAFADTNQFPLIVTQMFEIGEKSGNMSEVMHQIVEFYENDIDDTINAIVTMIEPVLTAFLAVVIVWIAIAVFGPIYSMFEDLMI